MKTNSLLEDEVSTQVKAKMKNLQETKGKITKLLIKFKNETIRPNI